MGGRGLKELVDRVLDGQLDAEVARLIDDGQSWEQIARWLYIEHDIEITGRTVRNWYVGTVDQ